MIPFILNNIDNEIKINTLGSKKSLFYHICNELILRDKLVKVVEQ